MKRKRLKKSKVKLINLNDDKEFMKLWAALCYLVRKNHEKA